MSKGRPPTNQQEEELRKVEVEDDLPNEEARHGITVNPNDSAARLTRENLNRMHGTPHRGRSPPPPRSAKKEKVSSANRRSASTRRSPSDTSIVSPPFLPTSRHHSFFLDFADDSEGNQSEEVVDKFGPVQNTLQGQEKRHESPVDDSGEENTPTEEPQREDRTYTIGVPPPFSETRTVQYNLLAFGQCKNLPLYAYDEICWWQKYNPCIFSGYRAYYNTAQTLKSFLGWHNETLNVWSHFTGFVIFFSLTIVMVTTLFDVTITASYLHNIKLIYLILCLGSMLCMINSTVYHLFTCHHHYRVFRAMGRLDFLGITALIIASFLPPLYTLFSCHRTIRTVYLITIIVLGMAGIIGPWTRTFHSSTAVRTSIYVGIVASGVVPGIHALFILPFNSVSMPLFKGIVLMLLFYSIGVVFYVMRIPESKFPGHFDYIFSSHQLWHFFVLMAAIVHYFNCLGMYQLMAVSDGQC